MSTFMILTRLYNMAPVLSLYQRLINYMTVDRKNNLFSKGFYDKSKAFYENYYNCHNSWQKHTSTIIVKVVIF